jgi:DNA-binding MarR family transcriptional regulator
VQLSDKGATEVSRLRNAARDSETRLLGGLGPEDRANLKTTINELYDIR